MKTLITIALRNLNRQKKRSILLGAAIAFGIFVVTVINGFAGAFQHNLAGNLAQINAGHLFIQGVEKTPKGKAFEIIREKDDAMLMQALKETGIQYESVSRRSYVEGYLVFEGKRASQGIFGVAFDTEPILQERVKLTQGSWKAVREPGTLVLNEAVAKKLKLEINDKVQFQLRTVTGQNNVGDFRVVGISRDMGMFSSMIAYTDQSYLNELLNIGPHDYEWFAVMLKDLKETEPAGAKLMASVKLHAPVFELTAEDLKAVKDESNQGMVSRYGKLQKQAKDQTWAGTKYRVFTINDTISMVEDIVDIINMVSAIILLVLFLIIMVGILNTFRMIMYERIKEIGTMRAIGMQRREVRNLFLFEAGFLAIGGTVAGWALSAVVMFGLSLINFGTGTFFALFLKNGHLSFAPDPLQMAGNFVLVLILTLVAAYLPARKASRQEPAAALRTSK